MDPIASGDYEWENQYENNIWTYSLDMVWKGLQESYRRLAEDVEDAKHFFPSQLPMDIAGQSGQKVDILYMLLLIQNGLPQMGNAGMKW